jgi:mannose-6-phosphate isomerase-like protein (cupin superfamily)
MSGRFVGRHRSSSISAEGAPPSSDPVLRLREAARRRVVAHDGEGLIEVFRPLEEPDFETSMMFVDYVVMPPGTSIGIHRHGDDEEAYFIVEGRGSMTVEDEVYSVGKGDLIVNRRGWSHGLANDSDQPIHLLIWQVAVGRQ